MELDKSIALFSIIQETQKNHKSHLTYMHTLDHSIFYNILHLKQSNKCSVRQKELRFLSLLLHLILFHQHLCPMDQASASQHQLFKKQSCEHCRQINDFLLQANQNQYWRLATAQSSSISYSSQTALSRILQVYVGFKLNPHFLQRLRTFIYNTKGMNSSN